MTDLCINDWHLLFLLSTFTERLFVLHFVVCSPISLWTQTFSQYYLKLLSTLAWVTEIHIHINDHRLYIPIYPSNNENGSQWKASSASHLLCGSVDGLFQEFTYQLPERRGLSIVGLFLRGIFMNWATLTVKNCILGWQDGSVWKGACLRAWQSEFNAQNIKVWRSELTTQGSPLMCVYVPTNMYL